MEPGWQLLQPILAVTKFCKMHEPTYCACTGIVLSLAELVVQSFDSELARECIYYTSHCSIVAYWYGVSVIDHCKLWHLATKLTCVLINTHTSALHLVQSSYYNCRHNGTRWTEGLSHNTANNYTLSRKKDLNYILK